MKFQNEQNKLNKTISYYFVDEADEGTCKTTPNFH